MISLIVISTSGGLRVIFGLRAFCDCAVISVQKARRGGAGDARYRGPRIQRNGGRFGRLPMARPLGPRGLLLLFAARLLFAVHPDMGYLTPRAFVCIYARFIWAFCFDMHRRGLALFLWVIKPLGRFHATCQLIIIHRLLLQRAQRA